MKNARLSPQVRFELAAEITKKAGMLKVWAILCPLCKCTIYSRARHDFRSCKCGAVSIDGGFDYMKCSFDPGRVPQAPVPFEFLVDATKKDLYDDYNSVGDRYGLVQEVAGDSSPARTKRPRTRRTPAVDRKPPAPRSKNPRRRRPVDHARKARR